LEEQTFKIADDLDPARVQALNDVHMLQTARCLVADDLARLAAMLSQTILWTIASSQNYGGAAWIATQGIRGPMSELQGVTVTGTSLPDFHPESNVRSVAVVDIVLMSQPKGIYVDTTGSALGLGKDNLAEVKVPVFQRGLKWNDERVQQFHNSLIQGWPIGVLVLATESSRLINNKTGQRRFKLNLIDGQQRTWALAKLVGDFWTEPWYAFINPKWDNGGTPTGSIVNAGLALKDLSDALGIAQTEVESAIFAIANRDGENGFDDYPTFLKNLTTELGVKATTKQSARKSAKNLAEALVQQFEDLRSIEVPVMVLDEALKSQLPSIFRRLNQGVPLKGYDLLAATWEQARLLAPTASLADKKFLNDVRDVAETRIAGTYADPSSGYVYEPNLEQLELSDLSLFDLLYYMSRNIAPGPTFNINSDVLAFQVAAMIFNGNINKVDDALRKSFPQGADGLPDIVAVPKLFAEAGKNVTSALEPMMDVTSKTVTLRGRVGLSQAVVYTSAFLTLHNRVVPSGAHRLSLVRRGGSADDRLVRPGVSLTAMARASAIKKALPAWFVHDSLTSVFAGSRAYEAANNRIWKSAGRGARRLTPANTMLELPPLGDLLGAFDHLWEVEVGVEKTPQRRRVSDGGSVLLRAAFSHLPVHDTVIDHMIPMGLGKSAATAAGEIYPLNHVANLMPLDELINNGRKDDDWDVYRPRLMGPQQEQVRAALLVPWSTATAGCLSSRDAFVALLSTRYRLLVGRALQNLHVDEWTSASKSDQKALLKKIAVV